MKLKKKFNYTNDFKKITIKRIKIKKNKKNLIFN